MSIAVKGCNEFEENEKYLSIFHFCKAGRIGTVFQTYPDALNVIEEEAKPVMEKV